MSAWLISYFVVWVFFTGYLVGYVEEDLYHAMLVAVLWPVYAILLPVIAFWEWLRRRDEVKP